MSLVTQFDMEITQEKFERYLTIQQNGGYNMLDPMAIALTDLSRREWRYILSNYQKLSQKFTN